MKTGQPRLPNGVRQRVVTVKASPTDRSRWLVRFVYGHDAWVTTVKPRAPKFAICATCTYQPAVAP